MSVEVVIRKPAPTPERGEAGLTVYVSTQGRDDWTGSLPSPAGDRTDGPVATIERARQILCDRRGSAHSSSPSAVIFRGGVYRLENTFCLTGRDSGSQQSPVIYRSYPGERATLSGGRRIVDWRTASVHGRACWAADLPEVRSGEWYFTQLFVDGVRRFRPRLPRTGSYQFADRRPEDFKGGLVRVGNGPTHAYYRTGDIESYRNPTDLKLIMYTAWYETHHRVRSIVAEEERIEFQSRGFGEGYTGQSSRYIIDNVFEALDSPGSWYLDRPSGTLYYIPLADESMEKTIVVAPRLATLLRLEGRPDRPVTGIRFEGISFEHSEWDYAVDCAGSLQAADLVPGAVELRWAEDCCFYDCRISQIAQYAIDFGKGCHANAVVGCVLSDLGAGGVRIGHEELPSVAGVYESVPLDSHIKPMTTTVSDCTIRDGGKLFPSAVGVWIGNAGHNRVVNNHIFNLSYSGISCGWIWGYAPSRTVNNVIEFNHVHHIAWDDLLHDLGGVYSLGRHPGGRMRHNLIHHVGGNGIYLDEGSSEFLVEHNTIHTVRNVGFTLHYGRDNEVRHNLVACSGIAHLAPAAMERHRSMVFHHNAITWSNGTPLGENPWGSHTQWWPQYNLCHDIILWDALSQSTMFPGGAKIEHWQKCGQFEGSRFADPLITDPISGDLSYSIDSPLSSMGIKPLTSGDVGPRFADVRPASFEEWRARYPVYEEPVASSVLTSDGHGVLTLEITNLGSVPIVGSGKLCIEPRGALVIKEPIEIDQMRIEAAERLRVQWHYELASDAPRRIYLSTQMKGAGLLCSSLHLWGRDADFDLPQIGGQSGTDALVDVMAHLHAHELRHPLLGFVAGTVRLAVAGSDLALDAEILDSAVSASPSAWDGSCIEIFAAPVGVEGVNPTQPAPGIGQVILVPDDGVTKARAVVAGGDDVLTSRVRLRCSRNPGGYRALALIPLAALRLADRMDRFTMQIVVTCTPDGAARMLRVPLVYYDAGCFASAMHHATVRVR